MLKTLGLSKKASGIYVCYMHDIFWQKRRIHFHSENNTLGFEGV